MIQPSHLVPPSAGTGPVAAANPLKPALQKAYGESKITVLLLRSRLISLPTLIGVVSFKRQGISHPSIEPLSP